MQQSFRQMTIADVKGEATPEEAAKKRVGEAKKLEKALKARRHEEHQLKHKRQRREEKQYRYVLHQVRELLENDAGFREEFLPDRDEVLAMVTEILAPPREPGEELQDAS